MVTLKTIYDENPLVKDCVDKAISYFEHNQIPLFDMVWEEETRMSFLTMKAPKMVDIFDRYVHGGYSAGLIDAIGALTALLVAVKEQKVCVTKKIVEVSYPKKVTSGGELSLQSKITRIGEKFIYVKVIIFCNDIPCVEGKVVLRKVKI